MTKHLNSPIAGPLCEFMGQRSVGGAADKRLQLRAVANSAGKRFNDTHRRIEAVGMHGGWQVDRVGSAGWHTEATKRTKASPVQVGSSSCPAVPLERDSGPRRGDRIHDALRR